VKREEVGEKKKARGFGNANLKTCWLGAKKPVKHSRKGNGLETPVGFAGPDARAGVIFQIICETSGREKGP